MLLLPRWLAVCTVALLGLAILTPPTWAFGCCCPRTTTVTYYQPAPVTACSPCQPPRLVPVTVTTTRCGLFGLRTRTVVSYGTPIPAAPFAAPAPVFSAYPPAPSPVISAYPPSYVPAPPGIIVSPR